jgi:hypothetical protein
MFRSLQDLLRIGFVWLALILTGVAVGDVVEDLVVEAAGLGEQASRQSPEVENPVENILVPSQGADQLLGAAKALGCSIAPTFPSQPGPSPIEAVALGCAQRSPPGHLIPLPLSSPLPLRL